MFDKYVKYKLNQVGPGFCLAKWTNSTMHLGMGKNHSCHHPHPHTIPLEEITQDHTALHNSNYKKQVRQEMLDGKRPSECEYCWRIEDNNGKSDRIIMSSKLESLLHYNAIKNSTSFDPTYLEFSFSNSCNFACAYCGPEYSSKWTNEIKEYGAYTQSGYYNGNIGDQILDTENNPYIDAFWKYLPEIYTKLRTLRITGGEPLMSRHTDKLLNFIKNNPNKKLTLVINTNLGVSKSKITRFLSKLKHIENKVKRIDIATSGEAHRSRAEYVRDGLNYQEWISNCEYILENFPNVRLHIMCAYNLFAITSFTDFLIDVKRLKAKYKRVLVSITYVRDPSFMSIALAPKTWKHYLLESREYIKKNYSKETLDRFEHVINFFDNSSCSSTDMDYLKNFLTEYDKRRNKNFLNVFPEYNFIFK